MSNINEMNYLKKHFEKNKNSNEKVKIKHYIQNSLKTSKNFSKSDSEFKFIEGEVLDNLNILKNNNENKNVNATKKSEELLKENKNINVKDININNTLDSIENETLYNEKNKWQKCPAIL